jgi:hypothetical protein
MTTRNQMLVLLIVAAIVVGRGLLTFAGLGLVLTTAMGERYRARVRVSEDRSVVGLWRR